MQQWFEELVGPEYASAVMWIAVVLGLLVVVLIVVRVMRSLKSGTFVMGGRNRKTRLAVMDATAVDANRRLVLVRRDHMEHLLLIGGPNDLVVEAHIGPVTALRRGEPVRAEPMPEPMPEPARPVTQQAREREPQPQRPQPAVEREEAPRPAPPRQAAPVPQPPIVTAPAAPPPVAAPVAAPSLDFAPAPVRAEPIRQPSPAPEAIAVPPRVEPNLGPPPAQHAEPQGPQLVSAFKVQKGPNSDSGWMLQHGQTQPPARPIGQSEHPQAPAQRTDIDEESLEEEMNRLLDDLSTAPR